MNITATTLRTVSNDKYLLTLHGNQLSVARAPIHFIFVIDKSGSMQANNKLNNCIKSIKYALDYIKSTDYTSIITFNDVAESVIEGLQATSENKTLIVEKLAQIEASNGTNISAAVNCIENLLYKLDNLASIKHGIIFLTDGYATEGITYPDELAEIFDNILTSFQNISISTVGYGTNHNSYLLKYIAQEGSGSYSIVENILNVASVFGYIIGSLISCACYDVNLHVKCENDLDINTTYSVKYDQATEISRVRICDIVTDQKINILFTFKENVPTGNLEVTVKGVNAGTEDEFAIPIQMSAATVPIDTSDIIKTEEIRYNLSILLVALSENEISIRRAIREKEKLIGEIMAMSATDATRLMLSELDYICASADLNVLSQHSSVFSMNRGMCVTPGAEIDMTMVTPTQRQVVEGMLQHADSDGPAGGSPDEQVLQRTMSRTRTFRNI